ncbi:MAG: hypothetical protein IJL62_05325, partial [Clostridia bacterium]|nr:hypothetical protein [Clostridia bacterium]
MPVRRNALKRSSETRGIVFVSGRIPQRKSGAFQRRFLLFGCQFCSRFFLRNASHIMPPRPAADVSV